jgi:hypothetical protein
MALCGPVRAQAVSRRTASVRLLALVSSCGIYCGRSGPKQISPITFISPATTQFSKCFISIIYLGLEY